MSDIQVNDEVKVMVKFTLKENNLRFTDALYYDLGEYPSIPKNTITNAKQARFDNWKEVMSRPQPPIDLDKAIAECQLQINYYTQQKATYQSEKTSQGGGK